MAPLKICTIGSSFAAGPGIPPQTSSSAKRSGNNYANILSRRLGAQLTDLSVSGATLQNLTSEPQTTMDGATFAPQITLLPTDTDIVLLTAGGNDMGYIGSIMRDELSCTEQGRQVLDIMPIPTASSDDEPWTSERLAQRFVSVIDEIGVRAPGARVLLVEYLSVFGPETRAGIDVGVSDEQIRSHRLVADRLRDAYRIAGEWRKGKRCEVVPVADLSLGHCLGSPEPWVNGFSMELLLGAAVFHPNARGMEAVAEILFERLERDGSKL